MRLARLLLLMGWAGFLFVCITMAGVAVWLAPQLLLVLAVALVYFRRKKWKGSGWAFGTSRWAEQIELAFAGMVESRGLPLGTMNPPRIREAARYLQKGRDAESACRLFLKALDRRPVKVFASDFTHACAFAPPGTGKSAGIIIPYLLACDDSTIVIDIKGELYKATHKARRRMGHKIVVLDPYGQTGAKSDAFNPLDTIKHDSPFALDDCRALAEATVVRTGEEKERHWDDSAEFSIGGAAGLVTSFSSPDGRNIQTVAQILASPLLRKSMIETMQASKSHDGLLARIGDQLSQYEGKELGSVNTTIARHLRFLNTPAIVANTTSSSFDPNELATGKMTIYMVIPPDRLSTQSGLLRMWVSSFLRVVTRSGLKQGRKIRFVLDEAAALGHMESIENAVAQLRGYGLSCLFMYQSMGQLEKCYPKGQAQTFLSNMDLTVYFGTNDLPTAEVISNRLGDSTIQNWSENASRNRSSSRDHMGHESVSHSSNSGWNVQEGARKLLQPSEVLQLDPRHAIVFAPKAPPFMTYLTRYYERQRYAPKILIAIRCILLGLLGMAIPALITWAFIHAEQTRVVPQQPPHQPYSQPNWSAPR